MWFLRSIGVALLVSACGGDAGERDAASDTLATEVGSDTVSAEAGTDADDGTCGAGMVGDDCNLCTWESDEISCEPLDPGDVFDLAAIKALTLSDLQFVITDTVTRDGGTMIVGDWSAGTFPAITADGRQVDQPMRARAAIYVPDGWPATANPHKALVYDQHAVKDVISTVPATIAIRFGMLVLVHAEYPANWTELGYPKRSELNQASLGHVIATNPCVPVDFRRGNYQDFEIPQRAMRAITLVQRLAESRGGSIDEVAVRGFSKEGAGLWIASAVDDRITVAAPGGAPTEDPMLTSETWIASFGCDGDGPRNQTARGSNDLLVWYRRTPAGAAYLHGFDTSRNQDILKPKALIIDGDVHMPNMHDGQYYPLGSESAFLDSLTINHRYVRKATTDASSLDDGGDGVSTANVPILLGELLAEGADALDSYYPRITQASATIESGRLVVDAQVQGSVEKVLVWWSWSEDRSWSEEGQAAWSGVELAASGGAWHGTVDLQALGVADKAIAWYVEASNNLVIGAKQYGRIDASPVRFLQLPAAGTCPPSTRTTCEGF